METAKARAAHVLYLQPACEACAEAEALVQAEGIAYERNLVLASSRPGLIRIRRPDGSVVETERSVVPATPALWDREANALFVGLEAIERALPNL